MKLERKSKYLVFKKNHRFGVCYPHQLEKNYAQEKRLPDSSG